MKIKELFTVGDLLQSIGGTTEYLTRDNCQVENITKNDDAVVLHMTRLSDNEEGKAYLRVRNEYSIITNQLLGWAFASSKLIGVTLNQLSEIETGLSISSLNGNKTIKQDGVDFERF